MSDSEPALVNVPALTCSDVFLVLSSDSNPEVLYKLKFNTTPGFGFRSCALEQIIYRNVRYGNSP